MKEPTVTISARDAELIRQLKRKVDNIKGPNVRNTPDSIVISAPDVDQPRPPGKPNLYGHGALYQVLMTIDESGTVGWDWPRLHA